MLALPVLSIRHQTVHSCSSLGQPAVQLKKFASALAENLHQEFDPSTLEVVIQKGSLQDGKKGELPDELAVVLNNTGETLHAIPFGGAANFPSETESLSMVSRIGSFLANEAKQSKSAD